MKLNSIFDRKKAKTKKPFNFCINHNVFMRRAFVSPDIWYEHWVFVVALSKMENVCRKYHESVHDLWTCENIFICKRIWSYPHSATTIHEPNACINNMQFFLLPYHSQALDLKMVETVIFLLNIQSSIHWFVSFVFEKWVLRSAYCICHFSYVSIGLICEKNTLFCFTFFLFASIRYRRYMIFLGFIVRDSKKNFNDQSEFNECYQQ